MGTSLSRRLSKLVKREECEARRKILRQSGKGGEIEGEKKEGLPYLEEEHEIGLGYSCAQVSKFVHLIPKLVKLRNL